MSRKRPFILPESPLINKPLSLPVPKIGSA